MTHTISIPTLAPFELLSNADAATVWGRLQQDSKPVVLSTAWGAAGRSGTQVTIWVSNPPESARLAAVGRAVAPRRGLGRIFGAPVVVERRELQDSDVVLAVLLALHPRGTAQWPGRALPPRVQVLVVETAVSRSHPDGSPWRPRRQADQDAVAGLLCAMARSFAQDPSVQNEERLVALAERLPDQADEAKQIAAELA